MRRTILSFALTFGLLCLMAFRSGYPYFGFNEPVCNTTFERLLLRSERLLPYWDDYGLKLEADTSSKLRILMLNYSVYGNAYNEKVHNIIHRYLPNSSFIDFKEGTAGDLSMSLSGCDAVVVAYPSASIAGNVKAYSNALNQYVLQGGTVLFTGTHEFEVLQQFALFDLDFGYFSKERPVHSTHHEHPIFNGVSADFQLDNFAYPLDISDPLFVTLADVGGYPVVGFKPLGLGKVIYIGVEYYFDEAASSQMLINALTLFSKNRSPEREASSTGSGFITDIFKSGSSVKRSEEMLYAGSGLKAESIDLKVYPNPYFAKANLDIELTKPTPVMVEMSDEQGRIVSLVMPKKTLGPGLCRFDLPNIAPGIYFLKIQLGDNTYVRKVVKAASN
jgi:Secretion system C-terminal sorting domain